MSKLKLSSNASGSGNVTLESPNTNSDFTVTVPSGTGALPLMKLETAVSASGTAVDFTSIPSWVKRITVMFSGVSTSGTSNVIVQLGAGSLTTSSYVGSHVRFAAAAVATASWAGSGIEFAMPVASYAWSGSLFITNFSSDIWTANGFMGSTTNAYGLQTGGNSADLGDALDRIRITTVNGTDTFDAGTINILYEG